MRSSLRFMPILAGALALAGWTGTADAQTVLNGTGSSAARAFMGDVPLNLCTSTPPSVIPDKFISQNGNMITWVCTSNGANGAPGGQIIIRYASSNSVGGYQQTATGGNVAQLDEANGAGCTGPTLTTRPSDSKVYNVTVCPNGNTTSVPTHFGASDVRHTSFHQTGGGTVTDPGVGAGVTETGTAIVPFAVWLGKGVVHVLPNGSIQSPGNRVEGLSRLEIEAIFSGAVTDWRQLGYGTVTDAAPTTLEATSPISLCKRNAGSGTKAALDETVMINASEGVVGGIFNAGTSNMVECLTNTASNPNARRAIGYMDADQVVAQNSLGQVVQTLAYPIEIDGAMANDPTVSDPKQDIKCGRYQYWSALQLLLRTTAPSSVALGTAFITNAGLQSTIGILPSGRFWLSDEEMQVFKNNDRGPLSWKPVAGTPNPSQCRPDLDSDFTNPVW